MIPRIDGKRASTPSPKLAWPEHSFALEPIRDEKAQAGTEAATRLHQDTQLQLTSDSLRSRAGRPKDHLFCGLWKRSTTYRAILAEVDRYGELLRAQDTIAQRWKAWDSLHEIERLCDRYVSPGSRSRNEVIRSLRNLVAREVSLLDNVRRVIRRPPTDQPALLETRLQALRPVELSPYTEVRGPRPFGKGSCNKVYTAEYFVEGRSTVAIIKPMSGPEEGLAAYVGGIPEHHPRKLMRNLATRALDKVVGTNVIVPMAMAITCIPPRRDYEICLAMAKVDGTMAPDVGPEVRSDAGVLVQLLRLQLLDLLCAQGDRHFGNYFLVREPDGRMRVVAIDNDQCFGDAISDPLDLDRGMRQENPHLHRWSHGVCFPPLLDRETAAMFRGLTPTTLESVLRKHEMSDTEVAAALKRLEHIQRRIDRMEREGRVIDAASLPDEAEVQFTGRNSYIGRDLFCLPQEGGSYADFLERVREAGLISSHAGRPEENRPADEPVRWHG